MLPKKQRLPIQLFLKRKTKEARTPYFILKTFPSHTPLPRLGVVIGRSVVAQATQRNHLRRFFFEVFRHDQHTIPVRDYLCILLPRIVHAALPTVREEFLKALRA